MWADEQLLVCWSNSVISFCNGQFSTCCGKRAANVGCSEHGGSRQTGDTVLSVNVNSVD